MRKRRLNYPLDVVVSTPSNPTPHVGEPVTFDGSASTDSDPTASAGTRTLIPFRIA